MTILLATLALPDDLLWADEYGPAPVLQTARRRLDGGTRLYVRLLFGGRPVTLIAAEDAWLTRAQADALTALAAVPGADYPLSLRGQSFQVAFRHDEPPALELRPLIDYADADPDDPVIGTIKLIAL